MLGLPFLLAAFAPSLPVNQESLEARLEAKLAEYSRKPGFVGASVAVVDGGKIVYTKGWGTTALVNGRAVRPDDRFSIGSITKQFTCACVMKLVEGGKLSPDDPISKYLSGITQGDRITVRQLMQHLSGVRDYYPLDYLDREMSAPTTPAKIVAKYGAMPLDFEPGSRYSYSNTGYTVLGLLVEKLAKKPLGEVMRERIFRPLGLTNTTFEARPQTAKGIVQGHATLGLDELEAVDGEGKNWCGAAGAIVTTASDLALWDVALMEGRVLRPESMAQMTAPAKLTSGGTSGYGFGLVVGKAGGAPFWEHGGGTNGFLSENLMLPDRKAAVVILTNSLLNGPWTVAWPLVSEVTVGKTKGPDPSEPAAMAVVAVPTVSGPSPEAATRELLISLRDGTVDLSKLTDDFRFYLTPKRRASIAAYLKRREPIGEIKTLNRGERGGMEVATVSVAFGSEKVNGLLYRETNGRIAELWLMN